METNQQAEKQGAGIKIIAILVFIGIGGLIMVVFSPLRPVLPKAGYTTADYLGRIALSALLGISMVWVKRLPKAKALLPVLAGLFIMSVAVSLDWIFSQYLLQYLHVKDQTPLGYALQKVNEFFVVAVVVIALTQIMGGRLSDLYIQKGNLKLGLLIGLGTFLVAAATAVPTAKFMFNLDTQALSGYRDWLPWLLIFVLANAAMEELLFRGLFLKRLQPLMGMFLSNFMVAFVFTGLHQAANYTSQMTIFLVVVTLLALLWGYIIQKTNALWASVLFHAGMDISILLGIFTNLK